MAEEEERDKKERQDRIYRFVLNEIAIAERQIDTYRSLCMQWVALLVTVLSVTFAIFTGVPALWENNNYILPLIGMSPLIAIVAIIILTKTRLRDAKVSSRVLYSLIWRKEFGLIDTKTEGILYDPFNYVV